MDLEGKTYKHLKNIFDIVPADTLSKIKTSKQAIANHNTTGELNDSLNFLLFTIITFLILYFKLQENYGLKIDSNNRIQYLLNYLSSFKILVASSNISIEALKDVPITSYTASSVSTPQAISLYSSV